MKRYALMQAPVTKMYDGQIVVVDNNTRIGKVAVECLIDEGYTHVGFLESDKPANYFKSGFKADADKQIDAARQSLKEALAVLS